MNQTMQKRAGVTRRNFIICSLAIAGALLGAPNYVSAQAPASAGPADAKLIEDLIAANRILVDKGIIDIRGHVSVRHDRDANRYLMSRALAPELARAEDILEFDLDNKAIDAKGRAVFNERFIHGEIYKARPDVKAVVHAHTPSIVAFSSSNVPLRPVHFSANFAGDPVPAFQNGLAGAGISSSELGQALAKVLGNGGAVMMRGHGVVVVGFSLSSVVGRSVNLDMNAQILARAIAIGGNVIYLRPPENAAAVNNPYDREWEAWKRKVALK